MYYFGKGTEQNYTKSFEYFQLAAQQGNSDAQFSLGLMYEDGKGTEQNYTEAYKYYKLAAEQGHSGAQHNLELMQENGFRIKK